MNKNTSPKGLSKPQALILARVQAHRPVAGLAGGLFVSGHEFRTAASLEKRGLLTLTPYGGSTGWAVAVAEKKPIVKGHPASPIAVARLRNLIADEGDAGHSECFEYILAEWLAAPTSKEA